MPLDHEHDNYAALLDEAEDDADNQPARGNFESLQQVLSAVAKKAWLAEVMMSLKKADNATSQVALMLILDVKTSIDDFIAKTCDLRQYELSDADWAGIELVTQWLKSFRSATTQMSTTKHPMLSSAYAIFRGLQESLQEDLAELPDSAPVDESPFYVWASILDPCILYYGLYGDCGGDVIAQMHIEMQKNNLHVLYRMQYTTAPVVQSVPSPTEMSPLENARQSPMKVNFTARYKK
ncbi:hypothetical protein BDR07DRAFT_1496217 [Suillus spraguei]|nr:hypothetical protein BDR07DRAFT_1496217 [Suillus spraguei]